MYKLVIADDESRIRNGLCNFLNWSELGFEIVASLEDGAEVIEYIKHNPVDVVLSDIVMCNVDGLEIARYIKENELDIPIVLISGYQEFEYARKAVEYGCDQYLLKPVSKDDLYKTVVQIYKSLENRKENKSIDRFASLDIKIDDIKSIVTNRLWKEQNTDESDALLIKSLFGIEHLNEIKIAMFLCKKIEIEKNKGNNCFKEFALDGGFFTESYERGVLCLFQINCKENAINTIRRHLLKINENTYNVAFLDSKVIDIQEGFETDICLEDVMKCIDCIFCEFRNLDSGIDVSIDAFEKNNVLITQDIKFVARLCEIAAELFLIKSVGVGSVSLLKKIYPKIIKIEKVSDISEWISSVYEHLTTSYTGYKDNEYDYVIARVKKYIEEHITEDLSVNRLARLVHLNSAYFGRYFKEHTLDSVNQYVLKVRMEFAIEQMYQNKSFSEIAEMIGYNTKYFFAVFKKYTGYSPKEFMHYFVEVEK